MTNKILKVRIDVTKLNKEFFFKGEKGTYADVTILYKEDPDQYGNNGMVVQDVPKATREKDPSIKGNILGNCREFKKGAALAEAMPEGAIADPVQDFETQVEGDLPF